MPAASDLNPLQDDTPHRRQHKDDGIAINDHKDPRKALRRQEEAGCPQHEALPGRSKTAGPGVVHARAREADLAACRGVPDEQNGPKRQQAHCEQASGGATRAEHLQLSTRCLPWCVPAEYRRLSGDGMSGRVRYVREWRRCPLDIGGARLQ
jgi:hypothetical protein